METSHCRAQFAHSFPKVIPVRFRDKLEIFKCLLDTWQEISSFKRLSAFWLVVDIECRLKLQPICITAIVSTVRQDSRLSQLQVCSQMPSKSHLEIPSWRQQNTCHPLSKIWKPLCSCLKLLFQATLVWEQSCQARHVGRSLRKPRDPTGCKHAYINFETRDNQQPNWLIRRFDCWKITLCGLYWPSNIWAYDRLWLGLLERLVDPAIHVFHVEFWVPQWLLTFHEDLVKCEIWLFVYLFQTGCHQLNPHLAELILLSQCSIPCQL